METPQDILLDRLGRQDRLQDMQGLQSILPGMMIWMDRRVHQKADIKYSLQRGTLHRHPSKRGLL
jgi:hypothetical protein